LLLDQLSKSIKVELAGLRVIAPDEIGAVFITHITGCAVAIESDVILSTFL